MLHTAENVMVLSKKAMVRFGIGEYHKARDQVNFVDVDGNDISQRRC
jgi:hypothetical protein